MLFQMRCLASEIVRVVLKLAHLFIKSSEGEKCVFCLQWLLRHSVSPLGFPSVHCEHDKRVGTPDPPSYPMCEVMPVDAVHLDRGCRLKEAVLQISFPKMIADDPL